MQWRSVDGLATQIYLLPSHAMQNGRKLSFFLSRKLGKKIEDQPDVVARVFNIKLDQL